MQEKLHKFGFAPRVIDIGEIRFSEFAKIAYSAQKDIHGGAREYFLDYRFSRFFTIAKDNCESIPFYVTEHCNSLNSLYAEKGERIRNFYYLVDSFRYDVKQKLGLEIRDLHDRNLALKNGKIVLIDTESRSTIEGVYKDDPICFD